MNMRQQSSRRYLKIFTAGIVLMISTAGITNLVIDPYGLFSLINIPGVNSEKPELGKHARMVKAHAVRIIEPGGLVLGSSRAEYGLDPDHPGWDPAADPVYNLALPSGSIYEALRYLQHAQAQNPLKQVVLALDLFMFNVIWQTEADFAEARLDMHDAIGPGSGWIRDLATALFSIDALRASITTIRSQGGTTHTPYLENGARHATRNWKNIKRKGGHHKAFVANETYSLSAPDGWRWFSPGWENGQTAAPLKTFEQILEFCRNNNIELYIIISPVHARKLEVLWQYGLWETFEQWKRNLTAILAADAAAHPRSQPFPLRDFSGYNSVTTETVPPAGDTVTQMQWFWEGSHYKKKTGDLMLDVIFNLEHTDRRTPDDFGSLLTPGNLDEHLLAVRTAREHYAAGHAEDINEIARLIKSTGGKH